MLALTLALALATADALGEGDLATDPARSPTVDPWQLRDPLTPTPSKGARPEGRPSLLPGRLTLARSEAQDDYGWEGAADDEDGAPRVFVTAWGGQAFDVGGDGGHDGAAFGGEVAYAFGFGDLGLWGSAYKIRDGGEDWAPIALLRLTNRFATHRGLDAAFTFGAGAGRPQDDWRVWFQVALGLRLDLGPMFLAGELSFEQEQLLRLSAGLGVKL